MKEEKARILLQRAEAQIGTMKIQLESQATLLKAAHLQITAATNELSRYRSACLPVRVWRWIVGYKPKAVK